MTRTAKEQAIAKDLELCDLIAVLGDRAAKAGARKHRKACAAEIAAWNKELDKISDRELDAMTLTLLTAVIIAFGLGLVVDNLMGPRE